MRYVPYHRLEGRPSIIVDGYGADGTVLTLSHWPGAGTPEELADDLSTQIVFRYLDRPDLAVHAEAVSNNHFDEDGLCGIYALLDPADGLRRREALIDVASAGDFGTFRSRDSARVATALMAYADADRSPMGAAALAKPYPDQTAILYEETLQRLAEMLDDPSRFASLWADEDARLQRDIERLESGAITIEELPDIDLAVVTVPKSPGETDDAEWSGGAHPMAIHNATERMRLLFVSGSRYAIRYRYETWVRYVSKPVAPRVDLAPLAERLSATDDGPWEFDDIGDLMPSLHRKGESSLSPERFIETASAFLRETR